MSNLNALESRLTAILQETNTAGGFHSALICTGQGLLVASAGAGTEAEIAAGLTSLFDEIAVRAVRDLSLRGIDELTLLEPQGDRYVIRSILSGTVRLYLVVQVPSRAPWRRRTNQLLRRLRVLLTPLMESFDAIA